MDASDLLRNSLLQLSKQENIRDLVEKTLRTTGDLGGVDLVVGGLHAGVELLDVGHQLVVLGALDLEVVRRRVGVPVDPRHLPAVVELAVLPGVGLLLGGRALVAGPVTRHPHVDADPLPTVPGHGKTVTCLI